MFFSGESPSHVQPWLVLQIYSGASDLTSFGTEWNLEDLLQEQTLCTLALLGMLVSEPMNQSEALEASRTCYGFTC